MKAILFFSILILSCQKPTAIKQEKELGVLENLEGNNGFILDSQCGWGNYSFISVTKEKTILKYKSGFSNAEMSTKILPTDASIWSELNQNLDWAAFQKINLNAGGIAFDGCNNKITISLDGNTHSFLYGDNNQEKELKPVINFLNKLEEIKAKYRE